MIQANRVAARRGLPLARVLELMRRAHRRPRARPVGEPAVNVLELNLALDEEAAR